MSSLNILNLEISRKSLMQPFTRPSAPMIPLIDQSVPENLQSATFAFG